MRVILGQSARRFSPSDLSKPLVLAGLIIPGHEGLMDTADGDVVLQALCKTLGTLQGFNKFLQISYDLLDKDGITDSVILLERCLQFKDSIKISQVSFSIEVKKPMLFEYVEPMQHNIAKLLKIPSHHVAITLYEASGLSDISCGDGINALCALTLHA
jgi:2-C-methyl-D-erythritol 2,4-cyclodiphosphate synthase